MLVPGKIVVNRTRSALSSAAHRTLREIRSAVYMQGLTGDELQRHRLDTALCSLRNARPEGNRAVLRLRPSPSGWAAHRQRERLQPLTRQIRLIAEHGEKRL